MSRLFHLQVALAEIYYSISTTTTTTTTTTWNSSLFLLVWLSLWQVCVLLNYLFYYFFFTILKSITIFYNINCPTFQDFLKANLNKISLYSIYPIKEVLIKFENWTSKCILIFGAKIKKKKKKKKKHFNSCLICWIY